MALGSPTQKWLSLPKWAALFLGVGTVFAASARADTSATQPSAGGSNQLGATTGEVLLRTDGGKIYVSERGKPFEELHLSDIAKAGYLKKLLEAATLNDETVAVAVDMRRTIVADGGAGWHSHRKQSRPAPNSTAHADQPHS